MLLLYPTNFKLIMDCVWAKFSDKCKLTVFVCALTYWDFWQLPGIDNNFYNFLFFYRGKISRLPHIHKINSENECALSVDLLFLASWVLRD